MKIGLLIATMAGLWSAQAHAQLCSASVSPIVFGAYDATSSRPIDTMSNVTVTCSGRASSVVSYKINIVGGAFRRLNGPGGGALYRLYSDASRTHAWGDCSAGQSCMSDSYVLGRTTTRRNYTIYSRLLARQRTEPGALADVIVVILNY